MKYFFGEVPADDTYFDHDDECFEHNGSCYYYEVAFGHSGNEDFVISDTCGRYIPVDLDNLDNLIAVLNAVKRTRDFVALGQAMEQNAENPNLIFTLK